MSRATRLNSGVRQADATATFVALGPAPSGGDDTAALQAAINAAIGAGKRRLLLTGSYSCSGQLNMDGAHGLLIEGTSTNADHAIAQPTEIVYSGTAAPFISAKGSSGVSLRGLSVRHSNAGLTGYLIDVSGTVPTPTSQFAAIDCTFGGVTGTRSANLFNLTGVVGVNFDRCQFTDAVHAIIGIDSASGVTFSNEVSIRRCAFNNFTAAPIFNAGTGWTVNDRTYFEPLTTGAAGAFDWESSRFATNLVIRDCGFWDVSTGGGIWINWRGGQGVTVDSNRFDLGSTATAVKLNAGQTATITGNVANGSAGAVFLMTVSSVAEVLEQGNYVPTAMQRQSGQLGARIPLPTALRAMTNTDSVSKWDTFMRSDNAANLGNGDDGFGWGTQSQRWAVTGGWAYCPGTAGYAVVTKSCSVSDGWIRALCRSGDTTYPDLVFRSNSGSTSFLRFHMDGTNAKIQSYVSGTVTDLATAAYPAYFGVNYLIEVFLTKNRVAVRVNGETIVTVTLGASDFTTFGANSYHGLGVDLSGGAGATPARFYDWALIAQ